MSQATAKPIAVDLDGLRTAIRAEYAAVASQPERGFHFHTGYRLAAILGYPQELDRSASARGRPGLLEDEIRGLVAETGFCDAAVVRGAGVFSGAPQHSNAAAFGSAGAGITARRP